MKRARAGDAAPRPVDVGSREVVDVSADSDAEAANRTMRVTVVFQGSASPSSRMEIKDKLDKPVQVGAPANICWPVRGYFAVVRHLEKVLHGHLAVEEVLIKPPLIGLEPVGEAQAALD